MLRHISQDTLHHTNVCIGDRQKVLEDISLLIKKIFKKDKKVEFSLYEYNKFLIEDAEEIFSKHIYKVNQDEAHIMCIAFNSTSNATQNSLLKILEEPPQNTFFFVIVPDKKLLLPTILSRAQIFEYKKEVEISKETQKFIKMSFAERLNFVKKIVEEVKKETKTKEDVLNFVEEIEKYTHQKKNLTLLKRIIEIKVYLKEQGASVKQLLEYLALQV